MTTQGYIVRAVKAHTKESFMALVSDMGYQEHEVLAIERTYGFIDLVHDGEYRQTLTKPPYIYHPLSVADLTMEDQWVLVIRSWGATCVAMLHDSVESMLSHFWAFSSNLQSYSKFVSWLRDEHNDLFVDLQVLTKSRTPSIKKQYFAILLAYGSINALWIKSNDRRDNAKTFGDFKTPSGEVDHARIKRKLDETLENFPAIHERIHAKVIKAIRGGAIPEKESSGWLGLAKHLHEKLNLELARYNVQMRPLQIS